MRCERRPEMLREGVDFVLYSILDFVVDNYMPVVDELEAEVERLEEALSGKNFTRKMVNDIFGLKRDLAGVAAGGDACGGNDQPADALRRADDRPRHPSLFPRCA